MYKVSSEFMSAINKPQRETRVSGTLRLKSSSAYRFGDSAIVQNSLVITDQLTGGKFGYGSVYSRNFSIKLDYTKIDGLEGVNINLTGAQISFWFYLKLDSGEEEGVLLGNFLVDSTKSSRRFNILTIAGNDYLTKLDVTSEPMENATPYEIFKKACDLSKQGDSGNTEDEISALPNGKLKLSFDTKQIQTARDMLMWLGDLTGTFVRCKRSGEPCPQLVAFSSKYTQGGTSGNFDKDTFDEDGGISIPASVRFKTEYTDTSIRTTTVLMNRKGAQLKSHKDWDLAADTLEGTMELENNPLIANMSDADVQDKILTCLREYTEQLRFCPFKVTFNGNPAIEVGDLVHLEAGGGVDNGSSSHYGYVTYSKWVYRGKCEIRCQTDITAERPKDSGSSANASVATFAATTTSEEEAPIGVKPKSQLEKRLDAESGTPFDRIVSSDGQQLIINPSYTEQDEDSVITIKHLGKGFQIRTKTANLEVHRNYISIESKYLFSDDGSKYNRCELKIDGMSGLTYKAENKTSDSDNIQFIQMYTLYDYNNKNSGFVIKSEHHSLQLDDYGLFFDGRKVLTE